MTPKQDFWAAYQRVAKAVKQAPDQTHAAECFATVQGYAPSLYDSAATRLIASCKFLPVPVEWLEAVKAEDAALFQTKVQAEREEAARHQREKTYHCVRCRDTGWLMDLRCTAFDWCGTCRRAGSRLGGKAHVHAYAMVCGCRQTNPVFLAWCAAGPKPLKGKRERQDRHE